MAAIVTGAAVLVGLLCAPVRAEAAQPAAAPAGPGRATVSVHDLIAAAAAFDGLAVSVEGEVVGDIMRRGDVTWINIHDGTGSLGIWGPPELFAAVTHAGAYSHRGDIVRVSGTFHRAATRHGGDLALEATSVTVAATGGPVPRPVAPGRLRLLAVAAALAIVLGGLWLWRWRRLRDAASGAV